MYLDGGSLESILETCSLVLGVSSGNIIDCINYYVKKGWIDEYVYGNKSLIDLLIEKYDINHEFTIIEEKKWYNLYFDKVAVFHITSRLNEDSFNKGILTLRDILNSENDIMDFLKDYEIEIKVKVNSIDIYYKQMIVSLELGDPFYNRMIQDTGVNGFLINHEIRNCSDVEHLASCPEFLQEIAHRIHRHDIINDWKIKAKPIIIKFETDIRNIHIDTYKNICDYDLFWRRRYLVDKYLRFLAKATLNEVEDFDKCMVFLNEYVNIPTEDIIDTM